MNENETCRLWDCIGCLDDENKCVEDCLSCDVYFAQSCENCAHFGDCYYTHD